MKTQKILLLSIFSALGMAGPALATSNTWTATSSGNWTTAGNWAGGVNVPGNNTGGFSSDTATFNSTPGVTVTVDAKRGLNSLNFDTDAGSFNFSFGRFYFASGGSINLLSTMTSTGQTETINTPITALGSLGINNNATTTNVLNIAGTLTNSKTTAGAAIISLGGTNTGANTLGGVISDGTTVATQINKNGAGTWVLAGANTYSGSTGISAGRLNINNASGSGTGTGGVSAGTTGILGGSGTILPGGTNNISVANTAHLAPGASVSSIGTLVIDSGGSTAANILVMASGSDFQFDLGAGGGTFASAGSSDRLLIANSAVGDVAFNANNIDFLGTGAAGVYRLFDGLVDSTNTSWNGLTLGGVSGREITAGLGVTNLASGMTGTLFVGDGGSFGSQAGSIYIQVVPEPATWLLLAATGTFFMVIRRRRRG